MGGDGRERQRETDRERQRQVETDIQTETERELSTSFRRCLNNSKTTSRRDRQECEERMVFADRLFHSTCLIQQYAFPFATSRLYSATPKEMTVQRRSHFRPTPKIPLRMNDLTHR